MFATLMKKRRAERHLGPWHRLTKCHILSVPTTKILPCLMQDPEIWESQCAKRIGEISGSCLFPNVVLSLHRNWVTALLCILPWFEHWDCACWPTLGRVLSWATASIRHTSFYRLVLPHLQSIIPLGLWLKQRGWAPGAGSLLGGRLWEPSFSAEHGSPPRSRGERYSCTCALAWVERWEITALFHQSSCLPPLGRKRNESELCSWGGNISWEAMLLLLTLVRHQLTQAILCSPGFRKQWLTAAK